MLLILLRKAKWLARIRTLLKIRPILLLKREKQYRNRRLLKRNNLLSKYLKNSRSESKVRILFIQIMRLKPKPFQSK